MLLSALPIGTYMRWLGIFHTELYIEAKQFRSWGNSNKFYERIVVSNDKLPHSLFRDPKYREVLRNTIYVC